MVFTKKLQIFTLLLTSSFSVQNIRASHKYEETFYDKLAWHYLPTIGSLEQDTGSLSEEGTSLSEYKKSSALLTTLGKHASYDVMEDDRTHLPEEEWNTLKLMKKGNARNKCLLSVFEENLRTTLGKILIAAILTRPITDINELDCRQEVIKELSTNSKLATSLAQHLKVIQKTP